MSVLLWNQSIIGEYKSITDLVPWIEYKDFFQLGFYKSKLNKSWIILLETFKIFKKIIKQGEKKKKKVFINVFQ